MPGILPCLRSPRILSAWIWSGFARSIGSGSPSVFFIPKSARFLARSSEPERDFFRIWTLKESYLKAEGTGFSVSPASFAVLPFGENAAMFYGETDYRFTRLTAFPDYCLSVCSLESDVAERVVLKEF